MPGSPLGDAFAAHHTWATLRLLDVCDGLAPDQLETAAPGTCGSSEYGDTARSEDLSAL